MGKIRYLNFEKMVVSLNKQNMTTMHKTPLIRLLKITCIFLIFTFSETLTFSQNTDVPIRYDDFIYDPLIKTVRLYRPEFDFSLPLLEYQSDQHILLSFDDLLGDYRQFMYTIELCDAWWQPVQIPQSDYISGFYTDEIVDYRFSGNTRIPYVHYTLTFPNDNMHPTKPGNYILKVWAVDSEANIMAFTRRFYVVDNQVAVNATITAGTIIDTRWYKQEVDFTIDKLSLNIVNSAQNLKVVVLQNNRWHLPKKPD